MLYLISRSFFVFLLYLQLPFEISFSQRITDPFEDQKEICSSIDIWYNVTEFHKLEDCRVILGNLEIVKLIGFDESSYRRLSFPKLREVTGYVLIYQVEGLTTLSTLFPNLTLIRGHELIAEYALIIYEVTNLKEVALRSLKSIERGLVRIQRNYQVCFVETIDWKEISNCSGHRIETYTTCPGNIPCRACTNNACWNSRWCQSLEVCHQECLGCSHINKSMCHRCLNYLDDGICVTSCPSDKVVLEEAKYCLTAEQCRSLFHGNSFIWNNTCIRECPMAYQKNGQCLTTPVSNKTTCEGMRIFTFEDLQKANNCQIINGPIILHISDHKLTPRLMQKYLGKIEVISDFLKIYDSPTIQTLDFFSNLRLIKGHNLLKSNYSILIYDMINLKTLFKNEVKVLRGHKGYLFNDQLCNLTNTDISSHKTNEFNTLCRYKKIEIYKVHEIDDAINITFSGVIDKSNSNIKQYKLSYTKDDDENLNTNSRLCCDRRQWRVINLATNETDSQNITTQVKFLHKLTPCIFYIEYFSFPKSDLESPAIYGKSVVRRLNSSSAIVPMPYLYSINSTKDTVHLKWRAVGNLPNSKVNYVIETKYIGDESQHTDKLNYCKMSKFKKSLRHKQLHHKMSTRLNCYPLKKSDSKCESGILELNELFEIYMRKLLYSNISEVTPLSPKEVEKRNGKYIFLRSDTDKNEGTIKNLIIHGYYSIKIQVCLDSFYKICSKKSHDVVRTKRDTNKKKLIINKTVNDDDISLYWRNSPNESDAVTSYYIQIKSSYNKTKEIILNSDFCVTRKDHELSNYSYVINAEPGVDYHISVTAVSLTGDRTTSCTSTYIKAEEETNQGYIALIWIFSTTLISLVILKGYCIWKSRQAAALQEDGFALVSDSSPNSTGLSQYEHPADGPLNSSYM